MVLSTRVSVREWSIKKPTCTYKIDMGRNVGSCCVPPTFRPMSIVAKRSPISANAEFLLFRWTQSVPILYTGMPLPASKLLPSNTCFPGPTRVLNLNGISIGSVVFEGLTNVRYRPTDRPRYSVGNNRPHLCTIVSYRHIYFAQK